MGGGGSKPGPAGSWAAITASSSGGGDIDMIQVSGNTLYGVGYHGHVYSTCDLCAVTK